MTHRKIAALGLAGLLVLAACGDDEDDAAPATTAAAVETTTAVTDMPAATGDIVAVASASPDFSTLVAAVQAAGLVETLQGPGPFTVFAPTNDAFAALPAGLVDALLLPENKETLTKILTYHVVAGKVMAADVTAGEVPTVEGGSLTITTDGGVKIFDANVVQTDIEATNGVIHVIDQVLVPEDVDVSALLGS
ncbi:MAG: fasciclin domain-containing protein [Acidimicrobiales bacterium]